MSEMDNPLLPLEEAHEEVREIVKKVLRLERDNLYDGRPRLKKEIVQIVEEVVN